MRSRKESAGGRLLRTSRSLRAWRNLAATDGPADASNPREQATTSLRGGWYVARPENELPSRTSQQLSFPYVAVRNRLGEHMRARAQVRLRHCGAVRNRRGGRICAKARMHLRSSQALRDRLNGVAHPTSCSMPEVSIVRRSPSRRDTSGAQPSSSRASVMSGLRCLGSSTGSASNRISESAPSSP